ncbi:Hypothetical protein LUCI_1946 [Lucifera butyrica]|uniref:Uncharacterized protein n=1 Tax=Lucifera butyrica TaxID=1351585 RepID=A0A498R718_9FIRM|nr:hypothetical protein [Lucifera butyrica]VBB06710.1 Hypothetical protein LUCI_1946 [Lucifera butyrica]
MVDEEVAVVPVFALLSVAEVLPVVVTVAEFETFVTVDVMFTSLFIISDYEPA